MLHKFQEIHSAPSELRFDCCDWLAEGIPGLSILMGLGLVCARMSTPFRNGAAGASTGYTARVESSNVGSRKKTRLALRDSWCTLQLRMLSPLPGMCRGGVNSADCVGVSWSNVMAGVVRLRGMLILFS
jgi:hypothetical protein